MPTPEKTDENFYTLAAPARAIYMNATKPRAINKNGKEVGEPKFDVTLGFKPTEQDLINIKGLIVKVAKAKWPNRDIGGEIAAGTFAVPISSGDKHADKEKAKGKDREVARGLALFSARSKFQPNLSVIADGKLVELDNPTLVAAHAKAFHAGAEVLTRVEFLAYEGGTGPDGVNARLHMILATGKGERLGGQGRSAAEAFKGYVGLVSNEDPTAGNQLGDEIPF